MWCTLHGSVFNLILLLLLACHSKAVFSDPGQSLCECVFAVQVNESRGKWEKCSGKEARNDLTFVFNVFLGCRCPGMVPLPDTAIDFSDLRSQSSRMNERVSRKVKIHLLFSILIIFLTNYTKFSR